MKIFWRLKYLYFILLIVLICNTVALAAGVKTQNSKVKFITITDMLNRKVSLKSSPTRIISLSPANTEIVYALGAGDKLVGVTTYCNYPAAAKKKPKVGDFINPNLEVIESLKPDLVLAGGYIHAELLKKLTDLNIPVISTEATNFTGILKSIKIIGKVVTKEDKAEAIVGQIRSAIEKAKKMVKGKKKARVFYMVWNDPLTTAGKGTFINDVIKIAGGENCVSGVEGWAKYNYEQILQDNPDIFIAARYSSQAGGKKEAILKDKRFEGLSFIKNEKVYIFPDDDIISRPGPRIAQAIMEMVRILHPVGK